MYNTLSQLSNDEVITLAAAHTARCESFYYAGDGIVADVYSVLCDAWECCTTRTKDYIAKRLMSSMTEVETALSILNGRTAVWQIGEGYTAL
jgi:hypothetical protein